MNESDRNEYKREWYRKNRERILTELKDKRPSLRSDFSNPKILQAYQERVDYDYLYQRINAERIAEYDRKSRPARRSTSAKPIPKSYRNGRRKGLPK